MSQPKSRFGLNLFLLFIITAFLGGVSGYSDILEALSALFALLFAFGCIYGFFRLFGARGGGIERFYQRFPVGWQDVDGHEQQTSPPEKKIKEESSFWKKICTIEYLRYTGILLILSSIFSLLFQIEWELYQKIIIAFLGGMLALVCAEVCRKKSKSDIASISSLVSFALFQFGISLLFFYFGSQTEALVNPYFFLAIKFLFTLIFLFSFVRYPGKFQPSIFFLIAYLSPFSINILWQDLNNSPYTMLNLDWTLPFIALLSLVLFHISMKKKEYTLLALNVLAVNSIVFYFPGSHINIAFVVLAVLFVLHLAASIFICFREQKTHLSPQVTHLVLLHLITLPLILGLLNQPDIPEVLQEYPGVVLLGFALCTFIGYMITQKKHIENSLTESLLNISIIVSAIGLFIEIEGKWTAIIFLAYSCAILWYGFSQRFVRTIIYGFIFLTVSLFKLYFVSPDIFESFSGSAAILVIGVILMLLSYKFESIKHYLQDANSKKKGEK